MTDGDRSTPGERKLVTMVFADLAGYTALAETLDPEDVYAFLRPTMSELQAVVESYGGSVPQIQGDGFMAVFGVPIAHEDDAERAVRAALAVRDRVRDLNAARPAIPLPEVHAGVNSGEVMVAPSREAAGFTVIGDTVNTASRLAGLARTGQVVVSETTRHLTDATIVYGSRRLLRAKGKAERIATSEALGVAPPTQIARPTAAFVDREDVLALLGRELELVERERRSRVLVVVGEPGIGKSRLALELGHSLAEDRFLVGRCAPFGDRPPLAALGDAIARAIGVPPGTTSEASRAAIDRVASRLGRTAASRLAADLRTLLAVEPERGVRSDRDAARAARLVLEDASRRGTVALVLDDLHWGDRSLDDLLVEMHRDPWRAPVFVLGLSREPVTGVPNATLAGLDRGSMRALAASILGDDAVDAVRVPVTRASGNALFLEEIVGMLVEGGAVRREATGGWRVADPAALREVPTTIRLVIAARLDALPPGEKHVLYEAAVCGATTWDAVIDHMGGVDDPRGCLRNLVARDLLRPTPSSTIPGATEYEWKHALIRDVAYDAIPRAIRAERHVVIAEWLRTATVRSREPVSAIAFHYERAWELSRRAASGSASDAVSAQAADYLTRSAEHMFRYQARAAEPLFRRALRVADGGGVDTRVAARAATGLAEVLIEMGAHAEAIEQATHARDLAERASDGPLTARAMLALGRSESDAGRMRRARTLLDDARERFEREGDLRGQGWALHHLSETWGWAGFERELEDLRAAYALFARARDRFGREVVAHDLAYILSVEGGPEFRRWYEQARRLTEDEGDLRSQALLLRTWGHACYSSGRFSEAADVMARCRPLAVEAGERYAEADALVIGALAGVNVRDPREVEDIAGDAIALGRELGSVRTPALARLAAGRAAIRLGRPQSGARALRTAREAVRSRRVKVMYGDVAEAEAMAALDRGAWGAAREGARRLSAALRAVPMGLWAPLPALIEGRAELGAGRAREAVGAFDDAIRAARSAGAGGSLELARGYRAQAAAIAGLGAGRTPPPAADGAEAEIAAVAAETAGVAALVRGDPRDAVTALDLAIERWQAFGSTSWLARASALRAEALRASGDRARAAASMGRARAIADAVGMPKSERPSIEHPLGETT